MKIGPHEIGTGRSFVIAEAALEHAGRPGSAHDLVDAAADAGADAVKFQTFRADELGAPKFKRYELPVKEWPDLAMHARSRRIVFLSTPFDPDSVDLLDPLVPAFKIASGEITNERLLRHVALKGKPVILSTGMATLAEINAALRWLHGVPVALLHCVSAYPAPPEQMNLRVLTALRTMYSWPVGLSDHTLGWEIALAAVAIGATVIEKHLTLPTGGGPDHAMSLRRNEFASMVRRIRMVESAMGDGIKKCEPCEEPVRAMARRDSTTGKRPA